MRGTSPGETRQLHLEGALRMKEGKDSRVRMTTVANRLLVALVSYGLCSGSEGYRFLPPADGGVLLPVYGPAAHHQVCEAGGEGEGHPPAALRSQRGL